MAIDPTVNPVPDEQLDEKLGQDLEPKIEEKKEEELKVPFHEDPQVQAYIERQVAKRIGEGNQAWEERLNRLEERLTTSQQQPDKVVNIGGWTPTDPSQAEIAKAIIRQAKQEISAEFMQIDEENKKVQAAEDKNFSDWLEELKIVGVLKTDEDKTNFARLIVEYDLNDKEKSVALWNKLQQTTLAAKEEGLEQGEKDGIKKAQEAKVGSARKGTEQGERQRTFQQRKLEEPSFDAILERELKRLGQ
ncbi:MAG TPA: hypothetical protein VJZ17_02335 [Nitrosopumilaceae archaeon]|nr:hypothetical protein [Nitrosopumilaceae archaeon]